MLLLILAVAAGAASAGTRTGRRFAPLSDPHPSPPLPPEARTPKQRTHATNAIDIFIHMATHIALYQACCFNSNWLRKQPLLFMLRLSLNAAWSCRRYLLCKARYSSLNAAPHRSRHPSGLSHLRFPLRRMPCEASAGGCSGSRWPRARMNEESSGAGGCGPAASSGPGRCGASAALHPVSKRER